MAGRSQPSIVVAFLSCLVTDRFNSQMMEIIAPWTIKIFSSLSLSLSLFLSHTLNSLGFVIFSIKFDQSLLSGQGISIRGISRIYSSVVESVMMNWVNISPSVLWVTVSGGKEPIRSIFSPSVLAPVNLDNSREILMTSYYQDHQKVFLIQM